VVAGDRWLTEQEVPRRRLVSLLSYGVETEDSRLRRLICSQGADTRANRGGKDGESAAGEHTLARSNLCLDWYTLR
jgi:hypothetical protein